MDVRQGCFLLCYELIGTVQIYVGDNTFSFSVVLGSSVQIGILSFSLSLYQPV